MADADRRPVRANIETMQAALRFDDRPVLPLVPAFVASASLHIAAIALASIVVTTMPARGGIQPALTVRLAPRPPVPPTAAQAEPDRTVANRDAVLAMAGAGPTPAPRSKPPDAAIIPQAKIADAGPGHGSVVVAESTILARLGEELEDRTHDQFGFEVTSPVRLPGAPVIAYPPDALAGHREASVLAWIVVARDGSVAEIEFPEGRSEFSVAVAAYLRHAHFIPAKNRGRTIRYFTMLEVSFRIGTSATRVSVSP